MAKVGDFYSFNSGGKLYFAKLININDIREPSKKYAFDIYSEGKSVYEDCIFVGEEYLQKWNYIGNVESKASLIFEAFEE